MTAHRIHTYPHPMRSAMPLLPMSKDDAMFWQLRKERNHRAASPNAQSTPAEAGRGKGGRT